MSADLPTLGDVSTLKLARAWCDVDPDSDHRDLIRAALANGNSWLTELFGTRLTFGTAGIRGALGPGPGAMNRVVVRVVASGLAHFTEQQGGSQVVVGFDARHGSADFATDIARVLAGEGLQVSLFDRCTPTPLVAFAVRHLGADAGVMVTASHNPATDNGLKIFGADGAILSPSLEAELGERILATPLVDERHLARLSDVRIHSLGDEAIDAYLDAICPRHAHSGELKVAYTPLHGVGYEVIAAAFDRAGRDRPIVVASQRDPDPDFPTAPFPNPEEPGVLAPLLELASSEDAALALANDPDADRLAVAVPSRGGWRLLSGDEVGCLLADHLLRTETASPLGRMVLNTVVSSRMLALIADDYGARSGQTLTGFKWLMGEASNEAFDAELLLAYEEAMGYAVDGAVRDKDGISAALAVAAMATDLAEQGRTLVDALDDLHRRYGSHVSGQRSIRFESGSRSSEQLMAHLRSAPPSALAGSNVNEVADLLAGTSLPPTDALVFHLPGAWLAIRPSGTEPKVKLYGEAWAEPASGIGGPDLAEQQREVHQRVHRLLNALCSIVADPEREETRQRMLASASTSSDAASQALALFGECPKTLSTDQALRLAVRAIDLTTLAGDDTEGRVRALCAQARRPDPTDPTVGPTAAVCVYPNLVDTAVELTRGAGIQVASVAGAFPSGLSSLAVRLADIDDAVRAGATEIDVVINRAGLLSGDDATVLGELKAMRDHVDEQAMKVILETSELASPAGIEHAARLAIDAGADWIKTSTGKSSAGATPLAVFVMAQVVAEHVNNGGEPVGIKVSGGVRTVKDALGYLAIIEAVLGREWLDPSRVRFGASGLLTTLVDALHDYSGRTDG